MGGVSDLCGWRRQAEATYSRRSRQAKYAPGGGERRSGAAGNQRAKPLTADEWERKYSLDTAAGTKPLTMPEFKGAA
jgi:hypothetical protein